MKSLKAAALVAALLAFAPAAMAQQVPNGYGNFSPNFGTGVSIAATTTSASTTLTGQSVSNTELYVFNVGTDIVFVRFGVGAQTALTTDIPIPAGSVQVFTKGPADTVAVRTATTTATVYLITGVGR